MKKTTEIKILGAIAAFFLPPLGVIIGGGGVGAVLLNIVLTFFLLWVPGFIHALYYAMREYPEA